MSNFEQLEREANDEFHLLESIGAKEFSTEHLLELYDQAHDRLKDYDRRSRINVLIGFTVLGWVAAFFCAYAYQNVWLAICAVLGLIFSLVACIAGIYLLAKQYKSRTDLEYSLRLIESELKHR